MPAKAITTTILAVGFFSFSLYPWHSSNTKVSEKPQTVLEEVKKEVTSESLVMAKDEAFIPLEFEIRKIGLNGLISEEGLNDQGLMAVPEENYIAGWWKYGAKIGENGNTILAGHFKTEDGGHGVFFKLKDLTIGDEISVSGKDGQKAGFKIVQSELYETDSFPTVEIYSPNKTSANSLILITCSGDFIEGNYTKRLVLRAERI
jgi:sortase A